MNSLKSLAMNCGPLSEMIRGPRYRILLFRALQYDLDVRLGHRLPDVPVHNMPAVAVQDAAQVVERPADVDVGHVDMPVLMRASGCSKPVPFFDGLLFHFDNSPAWLNPPDTRRAHRHDV